MGQCTACHKQHESASLVCLRCEKRTESNLRQLSGLYKEVVSAGHVVLIPCEQHSRTPRASTSRQTTPVRLDVLALTGPGGVADQLRSVLLMWYAALDRKLPAGASFSDLVDRLLFNLSWAAGSWSGFPEFSNRLVTLKSRCSAALDPTSVTPRVPVGRCPAQADDGSTCGVILLADPFGDQIRCTGCEAIWRRAEWLLLGSILAGS